MGDRHSNQSPHSPAAIVLLSTQHAQSPSIRQCLHVPILCDGDEYHVYSVWSTPPTHPAPSRCFSTSCVRCVRRAPSWRTATSQGSPSWWSRRGTTHASSVPIHRWAGLEWAGVWWVCMRTPPPTPAGPGWQEWQHPCRYHGGREHHSSNRV